MTPYLPFQQQFTCFYSWKAVKQTECTSSTIMPFCKRKFAGETFATTELFGCRHYSWNTMAWSTLSSPAVTNTMNAIKKVNHICLVSYARHSQWIEHAWSNVLLLNLNSRTLIDRIQFSPKSCESRASGLLYVKEHIQKCERRLAVCVKC